MNVWILSVLLLFGVSGMGGDVTGRLLEEVASYRVGSWEEYGRGNHRAVVEVAAPAPVVTVRIPWRRRDMEPESKQIVVYAPGDQKVVHNAIPLELNADYGIIAFEAPEKGTYYVYYLPYIPGVSYFDTPGEYFSPDYSGAAAWAAQYQLQPGRLLADLPTGIVTALEARTEFDRFDPMEVPATALEEADYAKQLTAERPYLVFPMDRSLPIRMLDRLPAQLLLDGPAGEFSGTAQPGECYPLQLGVWAGTAPLSQVDMEYAPLKNTDGAEIPITAMQCINLDRTDVYGVSHHVPLELVKGTMQPLWILIQVPAEAQGIYRGVWQVKAEGVEATPIPVTLHVSGEFLADGGVGDSWRLSRLKWLNSSLGINDEVVPPYLPLKSAEDGKRVQLLNREVVFGDSGMPEQIYVKNLPLLADAAELVVDLPGMRQSSASASQVLRMDNELIERETIATSDVLESKLTTRLEADGYLDCTLTLTAREALELENVGVRLPLRRERCTYLMGLAERGGYRTGDILWKWNENQATNMVWLGDAQAGLQLRLDPGTGRFSGGMAGPSESWDNRGRGQVTVKEHADTVTVEAASGARQLAAGESLVWRFQLLVTPFREQDPDRWNWRTGGWGFHGGNTEIVFHAQKGNKNINYPFTELELLEEVVAEYAKPVKVPGALQCPLGAEFGLNRGSWAMRFQLNFDPASQSAPLAIGYVHWKGEEAFGLQWDAENKQMRAVFIRNGAILFALPLSGVDWQAQDWYSAVLNWDDDILTVTVDGREVAKDKFRLADYWGSERLGELALSIGSPLTLSDLAVGERQVVTRGECHPEVTLSGVPYSDADAGALHFDGREALRKSLSLYYTVMEMSVFAPELWAFRSLGEEIFTRQAIVFAAEGAKLNDKPTGHPWLREHLVSGYAPAWKTPTYDGSFDMAIGLQTPSRWHNFYLAGVDYLTRRFHFNGMYLDTFGAGRAIAKRLKKVLHAANPESSKLWWHGGNNYDFLNLKSSIYSTHMDAMPFYSHAWTGEGVDFSRADDYYLVEISGVPFGMPVEMLDYTKGGNPYRGMVFGMTSRTAPQAPAIYRFWDQFDIANARQYGYWGPDTPVATGNPEVRATAYVHPGEKTAIALAHWTGGNLFIPAQGQAIKTANPIRVDGELAAAEWQRGSRLGAFNVFQSSVPAERQSDVYLAWDKEFLYIGFLFHGQGSDMVKASIHNRDGFVWEDDAVEIFIRPDENRPEYYHFVGNSKGVIFDEKVVDAHWDGAWQYQTKVARDSWSGEVAIPWSELGVDAAAVETGKRLGINVCRDQQNPAKVTSVWSRVSSTFHEPEHFGAVVCVDVPETIAQTQQASNDAPVAVQLQLDWEQLGLKSDSIRAYMPPIAEFQEFREVDLTTPIQVSRDGGCLIVIEAEK